MLYLSHLQWCRRQAAGSREEASGGDFRDSLLEACTNDSMFKSARKKELREKCVLQTYCQHFLKATSPYEL